MIRCASFQNSSLRKSSVQNWLYYFLRYISLNFSTFIYFYGLKGALWLSPVYGPPLFDFYVLLRPKLGLLFSLGADGYISFRIPVKVTKPLSKVQRTSESKTFICPRAKVISPISKLETENFWNFYVFPVFLSSFTEIKNFWKILRFPGIFGCITKNHDFLEKFQ